MSLPQLPVYQHAPLPHEGCIRLLEVEPTDSNATDLINCSLKVYELEDDIVPYISVSYSWGRDPDGDASLNQEIIVDDRKFAITENLHDGLVRLRPRKRAELLRIWIDAVCINQADIEERNCQVLRMAQIYSKASQLIIWLGTDNDTKADRIAYKTLQAVRPEDTTYCSDTQALADFEIRRQRKTRTRATSTLKRRALDLVKRHFRKSQNDDDFASLMRMTEQFIPSQHLTRIGNSSLLTKTLGKSFCYNLTLALTVRMKALRKLFNRRYFSRRWIVQEIFHSRPTSSFVHWGQYSMRLDEFNFKIRALRGSMSRGWADQVSTRHGRGWIYPEYPLFCPSARMDIESNKLSAFEIHSSNTVYGSNILLKSLFSFQDASCSDPRDRLFALSSMSSDDLAVAPDYSLSTESVYLRFAQNLIRKGYLPFVFETATWQMSKSRQHDDRTTESLPSWVPDLRLSVSISHNSQPSKQWTELGTLSSCGRFLNLRAQCYRIPSDIIHAYIGADRLRNPERYARSPPPEDSQSVYMSCKFEDLDAPFPFGCHVLRGIPGSAEAFTLFGTDEIWHDNAKLREEVPKFLREAPYRYITIH